MPADSVLPGSGEAPCDLVTGHRAPTFGLLRLQFMSTAPSRPAGCSQLVGHGAALACGRGDRDHGDQTVGGERAAALADLLVKGEAGPAQALGPSRDHKKLALTALLAKIEVQVRRHGHGPKREKPGVGKLLTLVPLLAPPLHAVDVLGVVHVSVDVNLCPPDDDFERCLHETDCETPADQAMRWVGTAVRPFHSGTSARVSVP